jgi:UDP-N-acetylmuramyl pentapeptide phosphotransferase/UDP-N-acetylglucosamine-1-phosphate transferase
VAFFLGAAALGWVLCHPVSALLRRLKCWDRPNYRSSHTEPTLRGGGLAAVLLVAGAVAAWVWPVDRLLAQAWLGGLALLGFVSWRDDRHGVPVAVRICIQTLVAVGVVLAITGRAAPVELILFSVFALVAFMNFVNFMDGINGLVTGQLVLLPLGAALLFSVGGDVTPLLIALVLAGAMAGFLPFNFPRPRIFLGDVGSVPLGFSCGVLLMWMAVTMTDSALYKTLAVLPFYFYLEGSLTVIRRLCRGEKLSHAHREHFYQRLVRAGWSHTRTTSWVWVLQLVVIALACWQIRVGWRVEFLWLAAGLVWGGFFAYAETVFRRSQDERTEGRK